MARKKTERMVNISLDGSSITQHAGKQLPQKLGLSKLKEDQPKNPPGVEVAGGARRSERAPFYHCMPRAGLRRIAGRWEIGLEKYGFGNWKKSLGSREDAYIFAAEAYNHMIDHAYKMANDLEPEEDHLGAVGWAVQYLAEVEEKFGCRWTQLGPEL